MRDGDQLNAIRSGVMGPDEYRVQNMPRAAIYRTAAISMANLADLIPFDTLDYDTDNLVNLTTAPTRLTIQTAGVYVCTANVSFSASAAGTYRGITVFKNATDGYGGQLVPWIGGGAGTSLATSVPLPLVPGDYIQSRPQQDTGGALALVIGSRAFNYMSACMISTL